MHDLLLVDDEEALLMTLGDRLRKEGYHVDCATDGDQAFEKAMTHSYDLIILDVMLPRRSGFAVCQDIRQAGVVAPILMLTARDHTEDRVRALEIGVDDYVTKPFDMLDLIARVKALLCSSVHAVTPVRAGS